MAEVPHERALVDRLKGKPFVLLGVNGDHSLTMAKEAVAAKGMNWRSWQNRSLKTGSITQVYEVHGFPAYFLIDKKGIIRANQVGAPADPKEREKKREELEDKIYSLIRDEEP